MFLWELVIYCEQLLQVLEMKADFTAARLHRANVYLKLAQYREAKEDYLQVVSLYLLVQNINILVSAHDFAYLKCDII